MTKKEILDHLMTEIEELMCEFVFNERMHKLRDFVKDQHCIAATEPECGAGRETSFADELRRTVMAQKGKVEFANPAQTLLESIPPGSEIILRRDKD